MQIQWLLLCLNRRAEPGRRTRSDQYAYQIAEIQQKTHKRASSVSSSENFSSSRSDSWRQNHHHHCGIPLRLLDTKRRANSWLVTRKTSQDSNLSSSRNDSSGSATTQSTSTWRMSRSSASSDIRTQIIPDTIVVNKARSKPRLTRQSAISDDSEFHLPPGSPGRLTVRFLTTIPSATETSVQNEENSTGAMDSIPGKSPILLSRTTSKPNSPTWQPLTKRNQSARLISPVQCSTPTSVLPGKTQSPSTLTEDTSSMLFQVPNLLHGRNSLPTIRSAPSLSIPYGLSSPVHSSEKNNDSQITKTRIDSTLGTGRSSAQRE